MSHFEKESAGFNPAALLGTLMSGAKSVGKGVASIPGRVAGAPGAAGGFVLNTARRGLNNAGAVGEAVLRGATEHIPMGETAGNAVFNASQSLKNLGTKSVGALQRGAEKLTGSAHTSKFNPLNIATGGATLYGGAKALGLGGGGGGEAAQAAPAAPAVSPAQQFGAQAAQQAGMGGFGGFSQKAQEMWGALPTEAKWAIGAGLPMALAGGLMGGKGGLGLGALGLGAAGLGAAGGGLFGDDARRMVGKGLYNVGSFFGGGGNDPGSQIEMLKKFSPGIGATLLMGRDPNLSAADAEKQYQFLTQNSDMIKALLPSMQQKGASALYDTTVKGARCWKGYEPVPGKKPYSEDSCRPEGSKKKKKTQEKQAVRSVFTRPTMTQMPPRSPEPAPAPRAIPKNPPPYHSLGQAAAEAAAAQAEAPTTSMVKTQAARFGAKFAASVAFKLTEKKPEEVVNGAKPSTETSKQVSVTRSEPAKKENLRPEGALMAGANS